jgi:hypothetical protein
MPSEWNMFVKKIYEEGKSKDSNYEFKQALIDASKRKSEMGHASASGVKSKKRSISRSKSKSRSRKASASASMSGGKKSRKNRRRSRR